MSKITFLRNLLEIDGQELIILPVPIEGMIQLQDKIIVLICSDDQEQMGKLKGSNVYAFDYQNNELWKIKPSQAIDEKVYSYSDINLNTNGELIVGTTMGTEYLVDLTNGSLKPYGSGRPW